MSEKPIFRFRMRWLLRPTDSYYVSRWDKAIPVTALAATEQEAQDKVRAMLSESAHGYKWVFITDGIDEAAQNELSREA